MERNEARPLGMGANFVDWCYLFSDSFRQRSPDSAGENIALTSSSMRCFCIQRLCVLGNSTVEDIMWVCNRLRKPSRRRSPHETSESAGWSLTNPRYHVVCASNVNDIIFGRQQARVPSLPSKCAKHDLCLFHVKTSKTDLQAIDQIAHCRSAVHEIAGC